MPRERLGGCMAGGLQKTLGWKRLTEDRVQCCRTVAGPRR
jgi:hypothetical protein